MVALPDSARKLLEDRAYGHVVTRNADGSPQLSMVWLDLDGDELVFNTAEGRLKTRNMHRDPRVIVSVQNRHDPQQCLLVHGRVTAITTEGALEHVDKLAKRFLDQDTYTYRAPEEERVIVRIAAERLSGRGPWNPME